MKTTRFLIVASIAFLCSSGAASAQLRPELYASDLSQPVGFVQDPSQSNVQMVVEQAGRIRVIQNGVLLAEPFLDLSSQVMNDGERGLLGLVFAPDYAASGRVYVQFTDVLGNTVVSRFVRDSADVLRLDRSTRFDLVWPGGLPYLEQPWSTHKGGNLLFGADGYLYLGLGDGDHGNGPLHLAQTPTSLLGKMLRLDVSVDLAHPTGYAVPPTNPFVGQPGVLPEIWSFGLRNPWRFSFDDPTRGGTGALIIADVGEAGWEEVNYEPAGRGGRNYGWRNREGAHDNILSLDPFSVPLTDPIHEYSHLVGRSITGGFVYRGTALGAAYVGRYFFADIIRSRVWSLGLAIDGSGEASAIDLQEHTAQLGGAARNVSTFGVDASGELYLVSYGQGQISRIAFEGAAPPPPPTSCTTPQPGFDWVCANGNWYPPGMPIPGGPPPTDPPIDPPSDPPIDPPTDPPTDPEPPQPPPPPPPGGAVCPTVQPGADWVCANGNWYPPGMTIPSGPPAPPPPPPPPGPEDPPAPPPPPPDPPPPSVCPTVQPGSDWTCANGNWYPPGMVIPSGPPAPPPPPPPPGEPTDPPPPPPPTVDSSCATPDPFVAIPGLIGLCIDGNWIPIDVVSGAGTVRFQNLEGGFWAIEMDDGRIFAPLVAFPEEFRIEGRRVTVTGKPRPDVVSAIQVAVIEIISIN